MNFERVALYKQKTDSPYYRPLIPEEHFDPLFDQMIELSVGLLSQADPSRIEEYKTLPAKYYKELHQKEFKDNFRDFFAGCHDPESELFKMAMYKNVVKISTYIRFLYEKDYDKENLDKIQIKHPMYIVSMPRSGSTFAHRVLSSSPNAQTIAIYEHFAPGSKTMAIEGRFGIVQQICNDLTDLEGGKDLNQIHAIESIKVAEEELFFNEMLGLSMVFPCSLPRFEQYREHMFTRNYDYVYQGILDEMKMHAVEYPFTNEKDYFCMKCVTHFMTIEPFLNIQCKDELEPRIVWLHREPVGNLKSAILLYLNDRGGYEVGSIKISLNCMKLS